MNRTTVIGSFASRSEVRKAIHALHRKGIPDSCIGIIARNDASGDVQHAYCNGAIGPRVAATGAGSLVGGLVTLGVPRERASYCRTEVASGRLLIVVQGDSRIGVDDILDDSGGMILATTATSLQH